MLTVKINETDKLSVHGFLIGVELEAGADPNVLMKHIGDAISTYPGVGTVDIEHLGEIEVVDPGVVKES